MRGIASIYLLCGQSKFDMRFALDMHTLRCVDMPCKQGVIFARRVRKALAITKVGLLILIIKEPTSSDGILKSFLRVEIGVFQAFACGG